MIKSYKYKIGDKVTFPTGKIAKVIARFHPSNQLQFNSYVVDLTEPLFSEAHGMRIHTVSVAESFLVEPKAEQPMVPLGFASQNPETGETTIRTTVENDPEPDCHTQSVKWVKWYRRKNCCGLYDAVQELRKRQGFRQDHNPDPLI
jgi:hypothetical protein